MNLKEQIHRISSLIYENKLDDLIAKYNESYSDEYDGVIEIAYEGDPSPSKKYFTWISKIFIEGTESNMDIDLHNLIQMVQYFDKNIHKFEKKDIYQYTYDEFIKKYEEAITNISKRELQIAGVDKLYEDDKYLLVRPKNVEALVNTDLILNGVLPNRNNYFERYNDDNLFFFIIDKLREPLPGKKKSVNYFKIAIQYTPLRNNIYLDKENFLKLSQIGEITFWNAVDESVSPSTVKKYIDKDILKKFVYLIKQYTYKIYSDYYEILTKNKESFDLEKYERVVQEMNQKTQELKTMKKSYSSTKSVRFVNKTKSLYESLQEYLRVMRLPQKTFDQFLDFNEIKNEFYEHYKNKEVLDKKLNDLTKEVDSIYNEFYKLQHEKDSWDNFITFEKY